MGTPACQAVEPPKFEPQSTVTSPTSAVPQTSSAALYVLPPQPNQPGIFFPYRSAHSSVDSNLPIESSRSLHESITSQGAAADAQGAPRIAPKPEGSNASAPILEPCQSVGLSTGSQFNFQHPPTSSSSRDPRDGQQTFPQSYDNYSTTQQHHMNRPLPQSQFPLNQPYTTQPSKLHDISGTSIQQFPPFPGQQAYPMPNMDFNPSKMTLPMPAMIPFYHGYPPHPMYSPHPSICVSSGNPPATRPPLGTALPHQQQATPLQSSNSTFFGRQRQIGIMFTNKSASISVPYDCTISVLVYMMSICTDFGGTPLGLTGVVYLTIKPTAMTLRSSCKYDDDTELLFNDPRPVFSVFPNLDQVYVYRLCPAGPLRTERRGHRRIATGGGLCASHRRVSRPSSDNNQNDDLEDHSDTHSPPDDDEEPTSSLTRNPPPAFINQQPAHPTPSQATSADVQLHGRPDNGFMVHSLELVKPEQYSLTPKVGFRGFDSRSGEIVHERSARFHPFQPTKPTGTPSHSLDLAEILLGMKKQTASTPNSHESTPEVQTPQHQSEHDAHSDTNEQDLRIVTAPESVIRQYQLIVNGAQTSIKLSIPEDMLVANARQLILQKLSEPSGMSPANWANVVILTQTQESASVSKPPFPFESSASVQLVRDIPYQGTWLYLTLPSPSPGNAPSQLVTNSSSSVLRPQGHPSAFAAYSLLATHDWFPELVNILETHHVEMVIRHQSSMDPPPLLVCSESK